MMTERGATASVPDDVPGPRGVPPLLSLSAPAHASMGWLLCALRLLAPRWGVRVVLHIGNRGHFDPASALHAIYEAPARENDEALPSPGRLHFHSPADPSLTFDVHGAGLGDPFSQAWILASRRGERSIPVEDEHCRVPASLCRQWGEPDAAIPAIDDGAAKLRGHLTRVFGVRLAPPAPWPGHTWAICLTHDLDSLDKFRPARKALGALRREGLRQPARLSAQAIRWMVLRRDPHRMGLREIVDEARSGLRPTLYIVTDGKHRLDPGYDPADAELLRLCHEIEEAGGEIGLHPSYMAGRDSAAMRAEAEAFAKLIGHAPATARMHYLRWNGYRTPRALAEAGIAVDSTLGWPDTPGFRCATAFPIPVFHPVRDEPLETWELPLHVMDTTLAMHQGLSADAAKQAALAVARQVRAVGGVLVLLQHPHLASDAPQGGYAAAHRELIEVLRGEQPLFVTASEAVDHWRRATEPFTVTSV